MMQEKHTGKMKIVIRRENTTKLSSIDVAHYFYTDLGDLCVKIGTDQYFNLSQGKMTSGMYPEQNVAPVRKITITTEE